MASRGPTDMRVVLTALVSSCLLIARVPTGDARGWRKRTGASACDLNSGSWQFTGRNPYPHTDSAFGFDCSYRSNWTFLQYDFAAPGCNIQKFDPVDFLQVMRGKRLLIVGDSMAANTYSALAWSMPPTLVQFGPTTRFKSSFRASQTNATVIRSWSTFFVTARHRESECHLDILDSQWVSALSQSDYVAFHGWHHFFHKGVGFYKNGMRLSNYTAANAVEDSAVAMRDYILRSGYKGTAFIFTYSPWHGSVQRTQGKASRCPSSFVPLNAAEEPLNHLKNSHDLTTATLIKVFGNAGPRFRIMDIYKLSNFRADAHQGSGLGDSPLKIRRDCSHWCIPGLPNTWVDILYSMIKGSM